MTGRGLLQSLLQSLIQSRFLSPLYNAKAQGLYRLTVEKRISLTCGLYCFRIYSTGYSSLINNLQSILQSILQSLIQRLIQSRFLSPLYNAKAQGLYRLTVEKRISLTCGLYCFRIYSTGYSSLINNLLVG